MEMGKSSVGMGMSMWMTWWQRKHHIFPFFTKSKLTCLYVMLILLAERLVLEKGHTIRHWCFWFESELFLYQKTSVCCDFTGYFMMHTQNSNSNRC